MTIRRKNPRLQGLIGLGAAIDWFTRHGYYVAIPLNDSQPWDLIVENTDGLFRVQVKTTTARTKYGRYIASLDTAGGNQSFHTRKPFDNTASDLLFVLTDEGHVYLIPCGAVACTTTITLGAKYEQFRQTRRKQLVVGGGFEPP